VPVSLTPEQRTLRAQIGAHAMHASHDSREITAPARAAFRNSFERQVDPDGVLSPDERARRTAHALKSHMYALALKSAKARAKRAEE
jgi:hypothetical protein